MNFSLIDAGGLLLAIAACGLVLVAPGYALARLFGLSRDGGVPDPLTGVVIGLAILPALDSVAVRLCGLDMALGANLALAVAAVILALRTSTMDRPSRWGLVLAGYVTDHRQIDRRLYEQAVSGNVEKDGDGYRISSRGKLVIVTARAVAAMFDSHAGLLAPEAPATLSPRAAR